MLTCIAIEQNPRLVERYVEERMKLYADCPPSLPLLLRSKVFAVFRDEAMVGGFTLFVGEPLPLVQTLPARVARERGLWASAASPSSQRDSCEIGVLWLSNPERDASLSIAFWDFLLAEAGALGSRRYFFRYDYDSPKLRKLYRFAFSRTLHVAELTTAHGKPLRLAVCQVPLVMMRFNLALYTLRRRLSERWSATARRLQKQSVRALPEVAN